MWSRRGAALLLLAAAACREAPDRDPSIPPGRLSRARGEPGRTLLSLAPGQARSGEAFQRQTDGSAGLAVLGTGFVRGDVIHWNGRPLSTAYGSSRLLTAAVPVELLARPGEAEVTIENSVDPTLPRLRAPFRLLPGAAEPGTPGGP